MSFGYILVIVIVVYLLAAIRVLRQYERGVVFLLGKFAGVRGPGLTFIFVPIQQMVRVSLRTVTMQIPSQKIITKDNVSIDIAAVAYYHISDPEKAVIVIENVYNAINQISQTTVRNVVGRFSLDQLLSDTASINEQIKNVIDRHTEPWGTQVTAVEIKDIVLPDNMQRAMAKEAEAERERRAKIVAAEGEFQAAVKLGQAADIISQHPVALQLRTLQTMAEISIEKNSTIIFPAQFMTTVQEAVAIVAKDFSSEVATTGLAKPLVLIGEGELLGLRAVVLGVAVAVQRVGLLAQTAPGLPEERLDLRSERLDVGHLRSLPRFTLGRMLGDRRIEQVERGGLDLPFAELVLGAGDFSFPDRPQDCRLVEAGGCGGRREAIGHTHTHTIITVGTRDRTLRRNCCRNV